MAYIYQADTWCDKCGEHICAELQREGKAPEDIEDETTFDSDDYPKRYDPETEESDSPQNCASGNCAGFYGTFLENQLTQDGYKYLKSMLNEHGAVLPEPAKEWAEFYNFTYHSNPWESAHDWLIDAINNHASESKAELVSLARDMATALDSDQIQDVFQSDMDDDGYFKPAGWYSDEMEG